ncbi:MAG: SDR family NAD(P)-dependent oxidoreductase [Magnetococcales bacterium]|nr:SDR family NAD(P)-dependent oxidoreductase [Magnetococcales bacterium]
MIPLSGSFGMKSYFVTGAAGFIGRRVVAQLLARGDRVVAQSRQPQYDTRPGIAWVCAPLTDIAGYRRHLEGIDAVIHLAADARFANGSHYGPANVATTAALLQACAEAAPDAAFLFVSTIGAVDRAPADACRQPLTEESACHPCSDYGRSKRDGETLVRNSPLSWRIVRSALVVGEEMRHDSHAAVFMRMALQGGPLSRLDLPGRWSLLHVDDLAQGLILAADHPQAARRTLFAAGEPVRLGELFRLGAPQAGRLPMTWLAALLRPFCRWMPFQAKALLYDALVATDLPLQQLGWQRTLRGEAMLAGVLRREQARCRAAMPPGGLTLVTGAASGLGLALSRRLAGMGRSLVLVDNNPALLEAEISSEAPVMRRLCDLSRPEAVAALLRESFWDHDAGVTELFACAGFGGRGPVAQLDGQRQAAMVQTNLTARLQLAHRVLPGMMTRGFGRLVLISSSSAFQPLPGMTVYAASNAGVLFLGEGLAAETAPRGVEVITVCPGGMATSFQKAAGVKEVAGEVLMTPEEATERIVAQLGRGSRTLIFPFRSQAMALLARLLPRRVSLMLWNRLMNKLR